MDPSDDEEVITEPDKLETLVEEYKDFDENDIVKPLINTSQVSSIHNRIAVRSKASNYEEMILAFEYYLDKFGVFTQGEAIEMKNSFFALIDQINYKHYTILVPIFFIYAYCLSKEIAFPKSLKKHIAIEVYTKKTCHLLMEKYVNTFCSFLAVKPRANYNWNFYIRGFLMMIRSIFCNLGCDEIIQGITPSDEDFLQNIHDANSYFRKIGEKIKLESYRLLALGMIRNNFFNSIDLDHIFDLHVRSLITVLREEKILSPQILDELDELFASCPPNMKLLSAYHLERESFLNSQIEEDSVMMKYMKK